MPRIARQPPRSRLRTFLLGCGIGCGTVLLALLIVAGFLYSRLTAMPAPVAHAPASDAVSPQPQPGSPQPSPPPVDEQVSEIRRAVQSGQRVRVSLRVSEAQINDAIAQAGGTGGQLRDGRVTLRDHDLLATGIATWSGREFYATVAITPQASNGKLRLRVDSLRAGKQALPGFAVSRFQAELDRALAASPPIDERVYVEEVAISGGELVMSGQTVTP